MGRSWLAMLMASVMEFVEYKLVQSSAYRKYSPVEGKEAISFI